MYPTLNTWMRKPTPVTTSIMIIESWSSWIAASTATTTGSSRCTPSMREKLTSVMRKAASITPGPTQVGSVCVVGRDGPDPRSSSPPPRTASADARACWSARIPLTTNPRSGNRTTSPGTNGSKWPASAAVCPPCTTAANDAIMGITT
jgi:hypothetical protein